MDERRGSRMLNRLRDRQPLVATTLVGLVVVASFAACSDKDSTHSPAPGTTTAITVRKHDVSIPEANFGTGQRVDLETTSTSHP